MCGGRLPVPCHTDCDMSAPELVTCSWCELPVAVATDSNRRRWKSKKEKSDVFWMRCSREIQASPITVAQQTPGLWPLRKRRPVSAKTKSAHRGQVCRSRAWSAPGAAQTLASTHRLSAALPASLPSVSACPNLQTPNALERTRHPSAPWRTGAAPP